jgi:hypothetical protein
MSEDNEIWQEFCAPSFLPPPMQKAMAAIGRHRFFSIRVINRARTSWFMVYLAG